MKKPAGLLLIVILAASSLILVKAAQASIPKPSVPEFTVNLVAHPYDVPPTTITSIDQYTGKETVITHPGYRVENKSIEVTIKNQPFTPYADADGNEINLYYNVRVKGHFAQDWKELYSPFEAPIRGGYSGSYHKSPAQSSSKNTVLSLSANYPAGAQVDYQVSAHAGYYTQYWPYMGVAVFVLVFTGELSGWSTTQTLTIGEIGSTATVSPTATPNILVPQDSAATPDQPTDQSQNSTQLSTDQPDSQNAASSSLDWEELAIVTLLGVVILLSVVVLHSRTRKPKTDLVPVLEDSSA